MQDTMLTRPPCIPRPSRIPVPETQKITRNQQLRTTPDTQKFTTPPKPSCIPVFSQKKQEPASQTQVQHKKPAIPGPCQTNTVRRPEHREIKTANSPPKSPLLPTPPAPIHRQTTRTFIPRPPQHRNSYNRNSTFARPPQPQQQFLPRPYRPALLPSPIQHQIPALPRPYQQSQHSFIQQLQVSTYIPVLLPFQNIINSLR